MMTTILLVMAPANVTISWMMMMTSLMMQTTVMVMTAKASLPPSPPTMAMTAETFAASEGGVLVCPPWSSSLA